MEESVIVDEEYVKMVEERTKIYNEDTKRMLANIKESELLLSKWEKYTKWGKVEVVLMALLIAKLPVDYFFPSIAAHIPVLATVGVWMIFIFLYVRRLLGQFVMSILMDLNMKRG